MGLYLIADYSLADLLHLLKIIAMVAFGLGMVIFVHELGHFLVAKLCGVKCEKFYVGFDVPIHIGPIALPRTLWKRQWGETEYGIGVIPLGGYVKMLGQDDNPANAAEEAERIRVEKEGGEDQPAGPPASDSPATDSSDGDAPDGEPAFELDPRSYPAKSVPKRMAIISAGVIMNVIFAVIFATIAYGLGVSYPPCEFSATVPGDPAWKLDLKPGDRIVQIGKDGRRSEHLRFSKDLTPHVMLARKGETLDMLIRRGDTEFWLEIQPTDAHKEETGRKTIGVISPIGTTLRVKPPISDRRGALEIGEFLNDGDRIVAVDGQAIEDYYALQAMLTQRPADPLTITVERVTQDETSDRRSGTDAAPPERVDFILPPNPMLRLGLAMKIGPIVAVRDHSPAKQAGFQEGDLITSVNGEPVVDAIILPDMILPHVDEEITIEVQRKTAGQGVSTVALHVTPEKPLMYRGQSGLGIPASIESLGIAFEVTGTVNAVDESSPAGKSGLQAGDQIVGAEFVPADDEQRKKERKRYWKSIEVSKEKPNWPNVHGRMQLILPGTKLKLDYRRGDQTDSVVLAPQASDEWFTRQRGLNAFLTPVSEIHKAESFGEAMRLGVQETKESMHQVFVVLHRLATGGLSPTKLRGPGTIAAVAGAEASAGVARLLTFLTLLSANLAIINFLPIPILDGGHMVFLTAEAIRGRPVDEKLAFRLTVVGLSFILSLMIFVIGMDFYFLSGMAG